MYIKFTCEVIDLIGAVRDLEPIAALADVPDIGFDTDEPAWSASVEEEEEYIDWFTSFSGFQYRFSYPDGEGKFLVEYWGAQNGFLQQNLLPSIERGSVTVREVDGSYGQFSGPYALQLYAERKWETAWFHDHELAQLTSVQNGTASREKLLAVIGEGVEGGNRYPIGKWQWDGDDLVIEFEDADDTIVRLELPSITLLSVKHSRNQQLILRGNGYHPLGEISPAEENGKVYWDFHPRGGLAPREPSKGFCGCEGPSRGQIIDEIEVENEGGQAPAPALNI